jgi:hypothetical protein
MAGSHESVGAPLNLQSLRARPEAEGESFHLLDSASSRSGARLKELRVAEHNIKVRLKRDGIGLERKRGPVLGTVA